MITFFKKIKDSIKLERTLRSVCKEDKMIAFINDGSELKKQRVVVDGFFPAVFNLKEIFVEGEDGHMHVIAQKDIIENYSAQRRYNRLLAELKKKYAIEQPKEKSIIKDFIKQGPVKYVSKI